MLLSSSSPLDSLVLPQVLDVNTPCDGSYLLYQVTWVSNTISAMSLEIFENSIFLGRV